MIRLLSAVVLLASSTLLVAQSGGKVVIGIVPSLIAELSDAQQKFVREEFPLLVKEFTGLDGELERAPSPKELADRLVAGKAQFGVFQGVEFADVEDKHTDLKALLLSIYRIPDVKVIVVAKKEADFTSIANLKGKNVVILKEGKEHIRRYVRKQTGGEPEKFFAKVDTPANAEAALDALLLDRADAAIVDAAGIDIYKDINPGRYRRLKIVAESEVFPPSVVAYSPKKVDEKVMRQFRDGMLKADKSAKGRDVMANFKITAFEPVPAGFEKTLTSVREAYGTSK